jgi:uncharacterized protein
MMASPTMAAEAPRRTTAEAPERRCIVTRATAPKAGLVRFVVGPDDAIVPDLAETLPGRGLWVAADAAALDRAVAKNAFARAAKAPVKVPADLALRVRRLLAERCRATLGLARRAGQAVHGRDRVREAIHKNALGVLLTAADSDGRDAAELRRQFSGPAFALLDGADLAAALGRPGAVVHVGVGPGRLADILIRDHQRLAGLAAPDTAPAAGRSHGKKTGHD